MLHKYTDSPKTVSRRNSFIFCSRFSKTSHSNSSSKTKQTRVYMQQWK